MKTESTLTKNPFRILLTQLDTEKWQIVTLKFLATVTDLINKDKELILTYGEAFKVLEFLAEAQVIELESVENTDIFKIRKKF